MWIGLTGGVASGKLMVTRKLEQLGAFTTDVDILTRDVVALGVEGLKVIVARFESSVLAAGGSLDRSALVRVIFVDPQARTNLSAITHPLVRGRAAELEAAALVGVVVMHVIPLLAEIGQQDRFDAVAVVDTTVKKQLHRLTRHDGLVRTEAEQRVAAQASREERLGVATHVIDSFSSARETMWQVDELWQNLLT